MNLSNISNSEKFIPKKKNFDTIDENPKEKIKYIIVSNNVTKKDDFFDFYHYGDFQKRRT